MELFASDDEAKHEEAASLLALAERRLEPIMEGHADTTDPVAETYRNEREGWDLFYDALDALEEGLANDDADAIAIRDAARAIIDAARIKVGASA